MGRARGLTFERDRDALALVGRRLATITETVDASEARASMLPLEDAHADDRDTDYVLDTYEHLAAPEGNLRSVNLLYEASALMAVETPMREIVSRVREGLAPFRTVWGVKVRPSDSTPLSFELYFYDWNRERDADLPRVKSLLRPLVEIDAQLDPRIPWHMWSVELTVGHLARREPASVRVYVDMRSYEVRGTNVQFENIYTFHDPRAEIDDLLHRIRNSFHVDPTHDKLAMLLPPELMRCNRVCFANKQASDGLYFSRIRPAALRRFLEEHGFPAPLVAFFGSRRQRFAHLYFCVGLDLRRQGNRLVQSKASFYGSF